MRFNFYRFLSPIKLVLSAAILLFSSLGCATPYDDAVAANLRGDHSAELKITRPRAAKGEAWAQYFLGLSYMNGEGVAKNGLEAVKWFRLAAAQGYASAQFNLGHMYSNGEGVKQDHFEAVRWYRLAAAEGLKEAQFNLAKKYEKGQGVLEDYAEAVKFYRLAAAQGLALAQVNLGLMYAKGTGVLQDYAEAVRWYKLASEKGDADAQFFLGTMYYTGQGFPSRDFLHAHMWCNLAAANGNARASEVRDLIASLMTSEQLAVAQILARECQARKFKNCD
jgi:hypothetical protein